MINEVALVLLFGLFGWKTALLYASTGLLIAISAGWVIGRLNVERFVEPWVYDVKTANRVTREGKPSFSGRIEAGYAALGTALAFMMSVIGLSLPEMIILKKVVKLPLILIFVGVVASGIMMVGYLFNVVY